MDRHVAQQNSADELKGSASRLKTGGSGVRIPARTTKFFQVQKVQIGSWAHRASYSMSTGFFPVGKAAGALS